MESHLYPILAFFHSTYFLESRFHRTAPKIVSAPIWPKDKHVTIREAFHFAACVRRIGKVATDAHRKAAGQSDARGAATEEEAEELGIELSLYLSTSGEDSDVEEGKGSTFLTSTTSNSSNDQTSFLLDAWTTLSCCDGLCGSTLGTAAQGGSDCVVAWLCSAVVFGCQTLAAAAECRLNVDWRINSSAEEWVVAGEDFRAHLDSYRATGKGTTPRPMAITDVVSCLKKKMEDSNCETTGEKGRDSLG